MTLDKLINESQSKMLLRLFTGVLIGFTLFYSGCDLKKEEINLSEGSKTNKFENNSEEFSNQDNLNQAYSEINTSLTETIDNKLPITTINYGSFKRDLFYGGYESFFMNNNSFLNFKKETFQDFSTYELILAHQIRKSILENETDPNAYREKEEDLSFIKTMLILNQVFEDRTVEDGHIYTSGVFHSINNMRISEIISSGNEIILNYVDNLNREKQIVNPTRIIPIIGDNLTEEKYEQFCKDPSEFYVDIKFLGDYITAINVYGF
jgi:hypothetical protein